jgi:Gly-Xaa carboxypeptidase
MPSSSHSLTPVLSVPPAHTSIGILAALIVHLEANSPKAVLEIDTPTFAMAECFAAHGPTLPPVVRHAIFHARENADYLKTVEAHLLQDPMFRALAGTTQAVDIVSGGLKSNALPEQALVGDF